MTLRDVELDDLARLLGVSRSYVDAWGEERTVSAETVARVVASLTGREATPGEVLHEEHLAEPAIAPVVVQWEGRSTRVAVRVPSDGIEPVVLDVLLEDQTHRTLEVPPGALEVRHRDPVAGGGAEVLLPLPADLPTGYHELRVTRPHVEASALLVVAPRHAHLPVRDDEPSAPRRSFGVFAPLHAIRGARSTGTGTYGDLADLADWTTASGGGVVGLLPVLAGRLDDPAEVSPYAPLSRTFWSELYLDPAAIPELASTPEAERLLHKRATVQGLDALRNADEIDPAAQMKILGPVFEKLARGFFRSASSDRRDAFEAFANDRPDLDRYARFRAVGETRGTSWPGWPDDLRDGDLSRSADAPGARVDTHRYLQWIAHEQLTHAAARAARGGPGLYLDLPVGVAPDGFDTWRHPELFATDIAVGAPPDGLAPQGQNWGFPPLDPRALRRDRYRHLRAILSHHMSVAGVLRIDHVMGLRRLFWIPDGMSEGTYVEYPLEELLAILCLESSRHRTVLVGEDLGTVPADFRARLGAHRILRMHVAQTELEKGPGQGLDDAPALSAASVNTHDLPPFAAWIEGDDLDRWRDLGVMTPEAAGEAQAWRATARRHLLGHLAIRGDEVPDDPAALYRAAVRHLAAGPSALLLLSLEDLWGETRPQNVPGTTDAYPNWRRKATRTLASLEDDPDITGLLASVARARGADLPATGPGSDPSPITTGLEPVPPSIADDDRYLFHEGSHVSLYRALGAHPSSKDGTDGTRFAVWAPGAQSVSVIGTWNGWRPDADPMTRTESSGVWECFVPGVGAGAYYKYHVVSRVGGQHGAKADPLAFRTERPPSTASVVADLDYAWNDGAWMADRAARQSLDAPISIYEMHLGSWRRRADEEDRPLTYRELAAELPPYLRRMGFTHVEFLPVMEHPFDGSWGYQVLGYFAPTARFGPPTDFMHLVDRLHQAGIGVILDWVPSHFPTDAHGLGYFDGTHLYEHADPRQGFHPDWKSNIFNYGRREVRSFLLSSALFWLDRYHVDGIRVDAVASMLYLDYSRNDGEWIPNQYGGRENLDAISFLRQLNDEIGRRFPGVLRIAEESTSWPLVSHGTDRGGLGFDLKWDMGWMNDTLEYVSIDPFFRKGAHDKLTFRQMYAHSERFLLALSHDEVVHGKRSLLQKMPGDWWQKFANLRLLYAYMYALSGKKLLFMGAELGPWTEWNHDAELDWALESQTMHQGLRAFLADLNALYRGEPALHVHDVAGDGFEWIDCHDRDRSLLSLIRKGREGDPIVLGVFNFTPVVHHDVRIGAPVAGTWRQLLSSDARVYGGSGEGEVASLEAHEPGEHGRPVAIRITVPPLGAVFFRGPGGPTAGSRGR